MAPTASEQASTYYFRFLDLPVELRLAIYKRLPRYTSHVDLEASPDVDPPSRITLVVHSTTTSILASCHQVHDEAKAIIKRTLNNWVLSGDINIITTRLSRENVGALKLLMLLLKTGNQAELGDIGFDSAFHLYYYRYLWKVQSNFEECIQDIRAFARQGALILKRQELLGKLLYRPSIRIAFRCPPGTSPRDLMPKDCQRHMKELVDVAHFIPPSVSFFMVGWIDANESLSQSILWSYQDVKSTHVHHESDRKEQFTLDIGQGEWLNRWT